MRNKKNTLFNRFIAKYKSLIVWEYLYKNPQIKSKSNLPKKLFKLIIKDLCWCPLCTMYNSDDNKCSGGLCPLVNCNKDSDYERWAGSFYKEENRAVFAKKIYDKIKVWKIL